MQINCTHLSNRHENCELLHYFVFVSLILPQIYLRHSFVSECVCNINGTAPGFDDTCNYETGQCKCLSNVIGIQCDKCADGFWNLGSGKGCQKCDCCGEGSTQATCNQVSKPAINNRGCIFSVVYQPFFSCMLFYVITQTYFFAQDDGQCNCKPGYGGPRCCACENGYWGTPLNDCKRKSCGVVEPSTEGK